MLTSNERKKAYLKAIEIVGKTDKPKGICAALTRASASVRFHKRVNGYELKSWPELKLFKPTRKQAMDFDDHFTVRQALLRAKFPLNHWVPDSAEGLKIRKVILQLCAQMTK